MGSRVGEQEGHGAVVGAAASQANTVRYCDGQLLSVLFNDAANS